MSLTPQPLDELEWLLSELADDRLSEASRAALVELLRSEPEARDHYVRFMAFCSDLHEQADIALGVDEGEPHAPPRGTNASWGALGRWRSAWTTIAVAGVAAAMLAAIFAVTRRAPPRDQGAPAEASKVAGWLEGVAGRVEMTSAPARAAPVENGQAVHPGQTISTYDPESHVTIRLAHNTAIVLAGDSRVALDSDKPECIRVEYGNVTASVPRRAATSPLVFLTAEARVEVLGTRLALSRSDQRTRLAVLEGKVHVERLSDQRTVRLVAGQGAEVSPRSDLQPLPLPEAPERWSLDFGDGLPSGWQSGQLVFDDLPPGSRAAVRAVAVVDPAQNAQKRYQIRSHNAWNDGLFGLHHDTWIHVRYRLERPGTFLLYLVCRQHDFGQPVATVLTPGNLRQLDAGQWHTLTLPLSRFHRVRAGDPVPLDGQLVAFLLVFDSPEHNPGLAVERIWVTRGLPANPQPSIEPHEAPARIDEH